MESNVILGTAVDILKTFPKNSIDHVITDPPYNISSKTKQTMVGYNIVPAIFGEWDQISQDQYNKNFVEFLTELYRVCKRNANVLIWLDRPYAGVAWFISQKIGWVPKTIIAAVKKNPSKRSHKIMKSAWEACLHLCKGQVKTLNKNTALGWDQNVIFHTIGVDKVTEHPNEKYESQIDPLVEVYTNEGDIVLDPFCGSGVVAVVCKKKNRKYIVIDKDQKWIEATQRRLETTSRPII